QQRLGIAPAKTLVAGFSQGGIMSASVALTSPGSVAGFGILSGRILPEFEPRIPQDIAMHDLHALILHGRHDSKLGCFLPNARSNDCRTMAWRTRSGLTQPTTN
ncbi:MAG: phospholipase, partial [Pseudoxanthomonas sp.]